MDVSQAKELLGNIGMVLFLLMCIVSVVGMCITSAYKAKLYADRQEETIAALRNSIQLLRENFRSVAEMKNIVAMTDAEGRVTFTTLNPHGNGDTDASKKEADNRPASSD